MKRKLSLLLVALLVMAFIFSGCSSSQEPQEEEPPKEIVTLRIGAKTEPDSTSPLIATLSAYDIIDNLVYDDLIEYDDDLNPVGSLAESWTVSDDGLEWTFVLKEGIKWFDGEDFTADDVVWTYNALVNGEFPQSVQLAGVTQAEKVDDYTVKVVTEAPKADMEAARVSILPEHIYSEYALEELNSFAEEFPVGTGPFEMVEWEPGQFIKFKANEDYFASAPQIDEIVYVFFANDDTLTQALTVGEVDAVTAVATTQIDTLKADENIEVIQALGRNFTQLGFNCWEAEESLGNPLVLDPAIRLATDWALDKEEIVAIALNGLGTPGTSLIPPSVGEWHWEPGEERHSYNPEKAREILENAGYTDTDGDGIREDSEGNKLDFRFAVISSYGEAYVKASAIIQKNLQDIGINTTITLMDGGAQSDLIYEENFDTDMFIWGWGTELDPSLKLSVLLTEQVGKRSDAFYSNEAYDALYQEQLVEVDREKRVEIVHEMQKIIYEEAPYVILYNKDSIEAYRTDKFEGWTRVPSEIGTTITQVNKSNFLSVKPK
ncbi:MAG: hypothetical protein AVO33_06855 [delta proteobacterium ML8_F1]|nr:MAG: hypothetical protein AVO33_06855 [delta proteobacterium ML8_F1]